MTINSMARGTTAPPLRTGHRPWLLTVPGLAGVCYSLTGCGIMTGMTAGRRDR